MLPCHPLCPHRTSRRLIFSSSWALHCRSSPSPPLLAGHSPHPKCGMLSPPFPQYQLFCVFSSLTCSRFVLQGPCQHPQAPHQQGENRAGEGRGLLEGGGAIATPRLIASSLSPERCLHVPHGLRLRDGLRLGQSLQAGAGGGGPGGTLGAQKDLGMRGGGIHRVPVRCS